MNEATAFGSYVALNNPSLRASYTALAAGPGQHVDHEQIVVCSSWPPREFWYLRRDVCAESPYLLVMFLLILQGCGALTSGSALPSPLTVWWLSNLLLVRLFLVSRQSPRPALHEAMMHPPCSALQPQFSVSCKAFLLFNFCRKAGDAVPTGMSVALKWVKEG